MKVFSDIFFNSIVIILSATSFYFNQMPKNINSYPLSPLLNFENFNFKDTLYTKSNCILFVDLAKQELTILKKNGDTLNFKCSTGNPYIEKGMKTNEGIFVIQYKSELTKSTQFDNTPLLYWMGFNHGIGFHALNSSSYYRHLGKRTSSHGCIRLRREDAKIMYSLVEKGTPVLVHSNNNTCTISFYDSTNNLIMEPDKSFIKDHLKRNIDLIYAGEYFRKNREFILISLKNISHNGINISSNDEFPHRQRKLINKNDFHIQSIDKLNIAFNEYIFN